MSRSGPKPFIRQYIDPKTELIPTAGSHRNPNHPVPTIGLLQKGNGFDIDPSADAETLIINIKQHEATNVRTNEILITELRESLAEKTGTEILYTIGKSVANEMALCFQAAFNEVMEDLESIDKNPTAQILANFSDRVLQMQYI